MKVIVYESLIEYTRAQKLLKLEFCQLVRSNPVYVDEITDVKVGPNYIDTLFLAYTDALDPNWLLNNARGGYLKLIKTWADRGRTNYELSKKIYW
jgi:hypothetical protein